MITLEEVNDMLTEIVGEKPEGFRYRDIAPGEAWGLGGIDVNNPDAYAECVYGDKEGNPCCLVGQVIVRAGEVIKPKIDGQNAHSILTNHYPGLFTESAIERLQTVQGRQDDGLTWADAIRHGGDA